MSQLTQSDCEVKPLPFVYIYTRTGSLFTDTPVDSQIEGQSDSPLKHIESKISWGMVQKFLLSKLVA